MNDRIELPLRFDAAAMRRDLLLLEEADWIDHFVTQNYEGTWSVLPLRAPAGARHPIKMIYSDPSCDTFVDTPLLARGAYFQQVLAAFECPLQAVRLMKLTPGSIVKPHCDHDLAAEHGRVRLHIPITTNPDVDFWLNGERVVMREGECWYLRLSDAHSVANRGQTDRVHLVIDALVDPWLQAQLTSAERAVDRSSAPSDLERFRAAVRRDVSLQQRLRNVEDRDAFIALAVRLASESGCRTTADEIDGAMREARRRWREQPR
jgi:hypothetical protein